MPYKYDHRKFADLPGYGDVDPPEPDEDTDDDPSTIVGTDPRRLHIRPRTTFAELMRAALEPPKPDDAAPTVCLTMTELLKMCRAPEEEP